MREIWGWYLALQKKVEVKVHELQSKNSAVDLTVVSNVKHFLEKILTGSFRSVVREDPLHINPVPKITALNLCKRSTSAIMQQQPTDRRLGRARMVKTMKMRETGHWRMP